ncbi:MAG: HD domain-containing phosphohydrolase, partial [bacterium]|nr:HD domain-containing phosphohydrolase [bacterium]
NWPSTDVIIITGQGSKETAVEALRLGAQDYLTKPLSELDIVSQVVKNTFAKRHMLEENQRLTEDLEEKTVNLRKAVQRLSSLHHMGQALHSILDIRELLDFFVNLLASQLGAKRVSLMLLDEESGELSIAASVGIDEHVVQGYRARKGEGITGWVIEKGEALLVEDIDEDSRFKKHSDRAYDSDSFISAPLLLSVPIQFHQKTLGVINFNNKEGGGVFSKNDLEFVTILSRQAAIAIENARLFQQLKDTHFQAITALGEALEAKDTTTGRHSDRLLYFAMQIADRLDLDEGQIEHLRYAAVLHDIGKIGVPERILQKPGKLTTEEFDEIRAHPHLGAELVKRIRFLEPVAPLIYAHHEWYDGNGYPRGLSGEEIPIEARIVAVLDTYDAMTSDRPYRRSLGRERAIQELKDWSGRQFDPQGVDVFVAVLEAQEASRAVQTQNGAVMRAAETTRDFLSRHPEGYCETAQQASRFLCPTDKEKGSTAQE